MTTETPDIMTYVPVSFAAEPAVSSLCDGHTKTAQQPGVATTLQQVRGWGVPGTETAACPHPSYRNIKEQIVDINQYHENMYQY